MKGPLRVAFVSLTVLAGELTALGVLVNPPSGALLSGSAVVAGIWAAAALALLLR